MPATSASHMIFFIAAIVVATAIAGTLISTTYRFSDDIESRGNSIGNQIGTDIEIINDPVAMPYNSSNNTLTLYVLNIGSTIIDLDNSSVIILINGTAHTNLTFILPGGKVSWGPNTALTIVVKEVTLAAGDHRLSVIVAQGGARDSIEFRIT